MKDRLLISYSDCRTPEERDAYNARAAAAGYPKTIAGEYGAWQQGSCFSPYQSGVEWHKLEGRYSSIDAQFAIVALEDGSWLADTAVWDQRCATREEALRVAVQNAIAYARNDRYGHQEAIDWLQSFLPQPSQLPLFEVESKPEIHPDSRYANDNGEDLYAAAIEELQQRRKILAHTDQTLNGELREKERKRLTQSRNQVAQAIEDSLQEIADAFGTETAERAKRESEPATP